MRISDWSSDVCSSDLLHHAAGARQGLHLIDDSAAIIVIVDIELDFDDLAGCPGLRDGHDTIERQQLAAEQGFAQMTMFALVVLVAPERGYGDDRGQQAQRSEEHTSELQALMRISDAVFCLKQQNIDI